MNVDERGEAHSMSKQLQDSMSEATRLTNEGRLAEATAAIQRALGGISIPVASEDTAGPEGPVQTTGRVLEEATRPSESADFDQSGDALREALRPSRHYRGVPRLPEGLPSLPNGLPNGLPGLLDSLPSGLPDVLPGWPTACQTACPVFRMVCPACPTAYPDRQRACPGRSLCPREVNSSSGPTPVRLGAAPTSCTSPAVTPGKRRYLWLSCSMAAPRTPTTSRSARA